MDFPRIISGVLLCGGAMSARAVVVCHNDEQCSAGFFCEVATSACLQCLQCEDFKRKPPAVATSCVKSMAECGPCVPGLVMGNEAACAPADARPDDALPVKIWLIIGFLVLGLLIAMLIVILFLRKKKDLFRISTATWLRSPCEGASSASAPDPPPPYNPYSPVRPDSPYNAPDLTYSPPLFEQERSAPLIKRAPAPAPRAREADASQRARVYNPPAYVRVNPQSPISPLVEEASESWPAIHSEDTAPHDWTPDTSANDHNGNPTTSEAAGEAAGSASGAAASDLPALLAAARGTTLVAPPAKKLKTQDNNNNGNRDAASAEVEGGRGRGDAPAIYLNIVQINNTKL